MSLSTQELYWIAGFLEGEGSFYFKRSVIIVVPQVQAWPLERLHAWFGGYLRLRKRSPLHPNWQPVWHWQLSGTIAAQLAMSIYPLMSPKRQEQIRPALAKWKAQGTRGQHLAKLRYKRTHCANGHPYDLFTIIKPARNGHGPFRLCVICNREAHHRYNIGRRRELSTQKKLNKNNTMEE